jgi:hypothetical protein
VPHTPPHPAPDPGGDRLAALERAVTDLREDVRALQAALAAARAPETPATAPVRGSRPADPLDARLGRPASFATLGARAAAYARAQAAGLGIAPGPDGAPDLEAVVGRYGATAVAALLILMAAGAFLTWAVANYDLTPTARLGLGALAAAALAAAGVWLRRRGPGRESADDRAGSRRFGDVLLALALAVTHVEAWAAGPYLRLIPPAAALALAAAASAALAALAWRGRQQSLFLVGVGGALAAPFVTGSGDGHPVALRVYGALVLASALLAVPTAADERRRWRGAFRLLALGGAAYTAADFGGPLAMAAVGNPAGLALPGWMLTRLAPALFALVSAALPLVLAARRPAGGGPLAQLALAYLTAGAVALLALAVEGAGAPGWTLGLALTGTLLIYAALDRLGVAERGREAPTRHVVARLTVAAVAVVHPLTFLSAALAGLDRAPGRAGAGTAALWGMVAAAAAWLTWRALPPAPAPTLPRPVIPSAHAATAGFALALVPLLLFSGHDVMRATVLAAHAGLAAQLLRPLRHALALLAPAVVAGGAAAWAWTLLTGRPAYAYTPFLTLESVAGGAAVAAWAAIAWRVWKDGVTVFPRGERRAVVTVAILVALGWGREELAHAVAPDVATVLVIAYFALAGIGSIALGRARGVPAARQIGLLLALYAAAKALFQASQLDAVGLRVVSYLVVGGFFLGIAYWYRAAGYPDSSSQQPDATTTA